MAKELYIPVNGFSKKTSKFYAPVNGFSKEIVKAYCSVNGFSKLFYEKGGGGGGTGFWFFYETVANKTCITMSNRRYYKTQNGIAFFAIVKHHNISTGLTWLNPIFVSTDVDAVNYWTNQGGESFPNGSFEYNGETWYWKGLGFGFNNPTYSPDCLIDVGNISTTNDIINNLSAQLMPQIYSNDFVEDYILETPYNLRKGDKEKTIRKALAIWLYKNFAKKNNASYIALLTNIDTIVSTMLSNVSNYDVIDIVIYQNNNVIRIEYSYSNASSDNKSLMSKNTEFGYTWYQLRSSMSESGGKYVQIDTSGNIIYRNNYGTYTQYVGANISLYYDNAYRVILTNIGLNL